MIVSKYNSNLYEEQNRVNNYPAYQRNSDYKHNFPLPFTMAKI